MRQTAHLIFVLLLAGFCFSCHSNQESDDLDRSAASLELPEAAAPTALAERKIVREANLRFQVNNVSESEEAFETQIQRFHATVTNSRTYHAEESLEVTYTLRVAPEHFMELVKALQQESVFLDDKTITADDVTRQYVDVEARLQAKQVAEQRYLALLQQAANVQEVLAIEEQLQKLREEREAVQAQLKALQLQTRLSTIHVTIYQFVPASYTHRTSFGTRSVSALTGGWQLFKDLLIGLLYLWPLFVCVPLCIFGYRWLRKQWA